MNTLKNSDKNVMMLLAVLLMIFTTACGATFEDDTSSIVVKPTIISIVVEPPEAAPGDVVTASYLLADEKGTLTAPLQLWTLSDGISASAMDAVDEGNVTLEDGQNQNISPDDLEDAGIDMNTEFTFTVPESLSGNLEKSSAISQIVTLLVGMPTLNLAEVDLTDFAKTIESLIASGDVKTGLKTLVVSKNEQKNQNPRLTGLTARIEEDGTPVPVVFVSSFDQDKASKRAEAIAKPVVYEVCNNELFFNEPDSYCPIDSLYFKATVEDDAKNPEEAIRYQWISNDGDFKGRRDADQVWSIPCYVVPPETTEGEDPATSPDDPREDINLHPVYLILRDNGVEGTLGQSWAEFYVQIKLVDCP